MQPTIHTAHSLGVLFHSRSDATESRSWTDIAREAAAKQAARCSKLLDTAYQVSAEEE